MPFPRLPAAPRLRLPGPRIAFGGLLLAAAVLTGASYALAPNAANADAGHRSEHRSGHNSQGLCQSICTTVCTSFEIEMQAN